MKTKKNFLFKDPENTHVIKLKKRRYWWLLLFLLLIFLFIRIGFYVEYQVLIENSETPVEKAKVEIEYELKGEKLGFLKETDKNGLVKFRVKRKWLFEYLMFWQKSEDFEIEAHVGHSCYKESNLTDFYKVLKPQINEIFVQNGESVQITVKDLITKRELADANLDIEIGGANYFSGTTDQNGLLNASFPLCKDLIINANKTNYADTTANYTVKKDSSNNLTVFMRPLAKNYTVLLRKCYNAGRDHYELFIDDQYVAYYKTTSGGDVAGSGDGEVWQYDTLVVPLAFGKHKIEVKLKEEHKLGTCSGCTQISISDLGFAKTFGRQFGSNKKEFSWEVYVEK